MQNYSPLDIGVLVLELGPAVVLGLAGERVAKAAEHWPKALRILLPALFALPYLLVSSAHLMLAWGWLGFYVVLPVAVAWLLTGAATSDPEQRGTWQEAMILLVLGLAVDLRWLEALWPPGLAGLGKLLLVDAALYGFVVIRQLRGMGFDFHFRWNDWKTGLRELAFFAPIVIGLGLGLGFLHPHANAPRPSMTLTWIYIFIFVAVPEELFFRAWVQNLVENRFGPWLDSRVGAHAASQARKLALIVASVLFGLSHFNKRSTHFNWRYVILATIAGIFYGRAWRENRRVPASAITHASVDAIWTMWF